MSYVALKRLNPNHPVVVTLEVLLHYTLINELQSHWEKGIVAIYLNCDSTTSQYTELIKVVIFANFGVVIKSKTTRCHG